MKRYKWLALVFIITMLLNTFAVPAFAAEKEELFTSGARKVVYLEELDLFAIVGANGVITSQDGYDWTCRLFGLADISLSDIAAGNGKAILLPTAANLTYIYVSEDGLNTVSQVNTVIDKGDDGEKKLIMRPEMVYDKKAGLFFCGGLEVSTEASNTYLNVGLYKSTGDIINGKMYWEKVNMQGDVDGEIKNIDLYKKDFTYSPTDSVKYPATKFVYVYTTMSTDGNGHIILARTNDTYIITGTEKANNSTETCRLIALADVSAESEEDWKYNRLVTPGLVTGAYIDPLGNIITTKPTSNVDSIFKQSFKTAMTKTLDASTGSSQVKNLADVPCKISLHERFASNGKYMVSFPSGSTYTSGSWKDGDTHQNDIKVVSYANEEMASKYTYLVNNEETTEKMFGTHTSPKYFANIACNNDNIFVAITGRTHYAGKVASSFEIYTVDMSEVELASDTKDSLRVDRTDKITKTTTAGMDISSIILSGDDVIDTTAGDSIIFSTEVYDFEGNAVEEEVSVELVDCSAGAEEYLNFTGFSATGQIGVFDDYIGDATIELVIRATSESDSSIFAQKNIVVKLANPVTADVEYNKTTGLEEDDEFVATVDVVNNSSVDIEGFIIVAIRNADGQFISFVTRAVEINAKSSVEDIEVKRTLPAGDYTDATIETFVLNVENMYSVTEAQ